MTFNGKTIRRLDWTGFVHGEHVELGDCYALATMRIVVARGWSKKVLSH